MGFTLLGILNAQAAGAQVPEPAFLESAPLWLDAADASTITESSGSVSQWDNKGTLENFSQATSADQPTTGVSTLNGLNVIDFADDSLVGSIKSQWTFMNDGTTYFIAAVFRPTTGEQAQLVSTGGGFSNNTAMSARGFVPPSDSVIIVRRGVTGTSAVIAQASILIGDEYSIFSALVDPDNGTAADRAELFVNNAAGVKPNTQTNSVSTAEPTTDISIGLQEPASESTLKLAELIVVSGADATETNRQTVVDYLNAKWGVF